MVKGTYFGHFFNLLDISVDGQGCHLCPYRLLCVNNLADLCLQYGLCVGKMGGGGEEEEEKGLQLFLS